MDEAQQQGVQHRGRPRRRMREDPRTGEPVRIEGAETVLLSLEPGMTARAAFERIASAARQIDEIRERLERGMRVGPLQFSAVELEHARSC